jgi:phosphotransferase system enzyme I (PtsP)
MTNAPPPPSTAAQSARTILTRLHEVMASRTNAQGKLNQVVGIIGECLHSEVCSIYLLRGGTLELYATRGLNQDAVHVTRLALGEGLVGTIAQQIETLNLDEAAAHPDFSYRPETGEELFHSFAGVPIIRREQAVGVLCVQQSDPRRYEEIEIETLQTVAMVLSELIANADLVDTTARIDAAAADQSAQRLTGQKLVDGMGAGIAVFHQPRITIEHTVADDIEAERHRVYAAFDKMREQIDRMASQAEFGIGGEHEEVLGDRARPAAHPDADAPDRRPAAARPHARSGGSVEPADPHRVGTDGHCGADGPAARFDPDCAQPGPRRTARI